MAERGWRLNFRRWLDERNQTHLRRLRDMLSRCALSGGQGIMLNGCGKNQESSLLSSCTIGSLMMNQTIQNLKIWKAKIPLKIKIFHVAC
jgi:hypothetical protein